MEQALDPARSPDRSLRDQVVDLIARYGHDRSDEPFKLSSGGLSYDYLDGKRAVAQGKRLRLVGEAIAELAKSAGVTFDAVGGLTLGADPIAVAVAMICDVGWFSVRKAPKQHGKQKMIEGLELARGTPVLVVEDVATTGKSILAALDALEEVGAKVVLAVPLVDRGETTRPAVEGRGVRYEPLLTYRELGIEPVV